MGTELSVAADKVAPTNSRRDNRNCFDMFASSGLRSSINPTGIIRAEEQSSDRSTPVKFSRERVYSVFYLLGGSRRASTLNAAYEEV